MPQHTDRYLHPAKDVVRRHGVRLMSSVCSNSGKVLILPGGGAHEVPQLLAAGVDMGRIVAVERDRTAVRRIRDIYPNLSVYAGSLEQYLDAHTDTLCAANLDFDGAAVSFEREVCTAIARLDSTVPTAFGLSSLGSRPQSTLVASALSLSVWRSILGDSFLLEFDQRIRGNQDAGFVLSEPARTHMVSREFAVQLLMLLAIGSRMYHDADATAAHTFATRFGEYQEALSAAHSAVLRNQVARGSALTLTVDDRFLDIVRSRNVAVQIGAVYRFVYRNTTGKWRWSWYYRIEPTATPVSLMTVAYQLGMPQTPLHYVDFTGAVVSHRHTELCEYCDPIPNKRP